MKKIIAASGFAAFMLGAVNNASAFWSSNDWECMGPFGEIPGCNPYDEWDPRYWMEEMEDMWDDDDDYYGGGYGRYPYGGYGGNPYGGGYGGNPYGGNPYGGGYPQPYYGGGYMQQPYAPYPAPPPAPTAAPAQ